MPDVAETPLVILPDGFDERAEYETPLKGWLDHVQIQLADGSRYRVCFIDPVRLQQDMLEYEKRGEPYFAAPGLIILSEVTTEAMRQAVEGLWRQGYFRHLKPVAEESDDSSPR